MIVLPYQMLDNTFHMRVSARVTVKIRMRETVGVSEWSGVE